MSDAVVNQACDMRAPSGNAEPTKRMRITGTGSTAAPNPTALTIGEMATVKNASGAVAIRVGFGAAAAGANADAATGMFLAAGDRFDWKVTKLDAFVSIVADDSSSAFKADAWTSSGARSGE